MILDPPSDTISKAMETFRFKFYCNNFVFTHHASERMIERGINLQEIVETVRKGVLCKGKFVSDFIGGKFVLNGLIIVVYAAFGEQDSAPIVVTLYRDGETDDTDSVVLSQSLSAQGVPTVLPKPTARKPGSELSLAELEALLRERKEEQAYAERDRQDRERARLTERISSLNAKIYKLELECEQVMQELSNLD